MKFINTNGIKQQKTQKETNFKEAETRSAINSGRSSTYNNKRHSYELSHQAEIIKQLNKTTLLSLHQQQTTGISHKVINEGSAHNKHSIRNKSKQKVKIEENLYKKQINMKKIKQITKKNFVQNVQLSDKLHSHRDNLMLNRPHRTNQASSEDKQNTCPNMNIGRLNFITQKNLREKLQQQTKRKLLLNNDFMTCKSFKESKKSIGSGRSQTIQKRKQSSNCLRTKNTATSQNENNCQQVNKKRQLNNKTVSKIQVVKHKSCLKLKSPIQEKPEKCPSLQDEKGYSIKTLLKKLMNSEEMRNEKKIKKIIDCLTTNDNEGVQSQSKERNQGLSSEKSTKKQEQDSLLEKTKAIKKNVTKYFKAHENGPKDSEVQTQVQFFKQSKEHQNLIKTDETTSLQQQPSQQDEKQLIRKYQMKIISLYQQLIHEKQKNQQLQDIIERYITHKEKTIKPSIVNY